MPRRGFTLIETLAVLALLAVLTAATAVSLSSSTKSVRVDDAVERFVAFDRTTRDAARGFARTPKLQFELNRGTVRRIDSSIPDPTLLHLGGEFRITRVVIRDESFGYGETSVTFSDRGQSPSYAVQVSGPTGDRWVAFAGLTGQSFLVRNEREAMEILSPSAARPDTR